MITRNPTTYLISKFKEDGMNSIIPHASVRFVNSHLDAMPTSWHGLKREALIKRIRESCELGVATGQLKRKRNPKSTGYIYQIIK